MINAILLTVTWTCCIYR